MLGTRNLRIRVKDESLITENIHLCTAYPIYFVNIYLTSSVCNAVLLENSPNQSGLIRKAGTSPEHLLEMQIFRPHPWPIGSEWLDLGPGVHVFTNSPGDFDAH